MSAMQPAPSTTATTAALPRQRLLPLPAIAVLLMLAGLVAVVAMVRSPSTLAPQGSAAASPTSTASDASATPAASTTAVRPANSAENADISQLRVLRFDDAPDGSVAVIDVGTGELVKRFEGEQGFLRGTLRAMARERRLHGLGAGQPFELILLRDGRLTLHDPATGMRIALESFGATNTGVFARLLR